MSYKWSKQKRIRKRAEYQACYGLGKRHYTKLFVLIVKESDVPRMGMAVSKKTGNAVARNRVKRVLREFFRLHQDLMPKAMLVVIPKKHLNVSTLSLSVVKNDMLFLMEKLRTTYQ